MFSLLKRAYKKKICKNRVCLEFTVKKKVFLQISLNNLAPKNNRKKGIPQMKLFLILPIPISTKKRHHLQLCLLLSF